VSPLPPYAAVVLAGGRAARMGGQAKPQLDVGGRSMLAAVLAAVATDVVALLAGDLPFLPPGLIRAMRERLTGDGVLVVDDTDRDQLLLGVWRTAALRGAVADVSGPTSVRKVLAPLAVRRLHPTVPPGQPPPWTDCDTPADLARARQVAGRPRG
jgi:molybdopterin-guanine dinucleotide biosynthesis protein A